MTPPETTSDTFGAVRNWADGVLDRAHHTGPIPTAGSAAWCQLDNEDPRKLAAVVRAALARLYEGTREAITARLTAELDLLDRVHAERATAVAQDVAGAADWHRVAAGPTHRELIRRRYERSCPQCTARLAFTADRCAACGWTEPTPTDIRAAAHASWTLDDHTETAA